MTGVIESCAVVQCFWFLWKMACDWCRFVVHIIEWPSQFQSFARTTRCTSSHKMRWRCRNKNGLPNFECARCPPTTAFLGAFCAHKNNQLVRTIVLSFSHAQWHHFGAQRKCHLPDWMSIYCFSRDISRWHIAINASSICGPKRYSKTQFWFTQNFTSNTHSALSSSGCEATISRTGPALIAFSIEYFTHCSNLYSLVLFGAHPVPTNFNSIVSYDLHNVSD